MSSISSFVIHGFLANDWQQKYKNVYKNTIFVKTKDGDEVFFPTAFGKIGETLSKYTKKGQEIILKCVISGKYWNEKYQLNLIVCGIDFCGNLPKETHHETRTPEPSNNHLYHPEPLFESAHKVDYLSDDEFYELFTPPKKNN